ncbi:MAG TPA: adenylate/guanylate cyclase domain-containing protein [Gaiellaceae bacterium]|nr:adenylate/guanylate cyclase domain-containing protein [Gaiellaceae bacterium]
MPGRPTEQRKTVTVLFCDVVGSTTLGENLDPERLRALLARYFERMQAIVERYGGTVEKFIGDAVMAVFGVPVVHEDDALRAVRAASEMRDEFPELGLQGRIGVATGEVVTGTEERLATGDAVNVAARLEQAAQPGEVLLGRTTLDLVRDAVEVEAVEPLELKGKAEPVPAYRLTVVHEAREPHHLGRFVGREHELAFLRDAWERVHADRRCELVTVVGDAGVGKSRLVAEALASIEATVVRGRCLPYGEGITYWPVVELLKQLELSTRDALAAPAIGSLLGETDAATSAEEIALAVRKTLEQAAGEGSLVVVFDDIQWGEETFLDLVEHVALLSAGASILLLCLARPELTERRPAWPIVLRLGPLGEQDVDELIPEGVGDEARERIARAAAGNPLFVEEMVSMARERDGEVDVPPTLQALLAARLDQLETADRRVLERGSIEGEVFHRGAVQALASDETPVTPRLAALVRKELIRPETAQIRNEDGFRFHHILIRDAAYEALPKATRAELHERFAAWLEEHGTGLVELDELLGYHLEQASGYRTELGLPDDTGAARAARRRLTAAGHRAQLRSDYTAAVALYERASGLLQPAEIDLTLETELVDALLWSGRGADAALRARSLTERSAAAGDRVGELCGRIKEGFCAMYLEPEASGGLTPLVERALPVFESAGDDVALYCAHRAAGWSAFTSAQTDAALKAYELAAAHARRAGLPHELLGWRAIFRLYGATPVSEVLVWLDENEQRAGRDHWFRASRGMGLAMLGRFDEARAILAETRSELAERGGGLDLATLTALESAMIELLADDPVAAAALGEEGCTLLEQLGERAFLSTASATLAIAFSELDRLQEAEAWAARAAELGATDDTYTQMLWRRARAKALARSGVYDEAETLAREAVAIGERTEGLSDQGDAYSDLAEVVLLAGRADEAAAALEQALERYERKENLTMAGRTRDRLAALRPTTR